MVDVVLVLFGALSFLGVAVYGVIQILKAACPKKWRRKTRLGRATFKAAPLIIGAIASVAALSGTMGLLVGLVGIECAHLDLGLPAKALLGIASGTLSTTIHSVVRSRVAEVIPKAKTGSDAT